jgi:divalent metal cation (Fe/Co/Zn/Cd) transporter
VGDGNRTRVTSLEDWGLTKAYQIAHDAEHTLTHAVPKLSSALIHACPATNSTSTNVQHCSYSGLREKPQ